MEMDNILHFGSIQEKYTLYMLVILQIKLEGRKTGLGNNSYMR